MRNAFPFIKAPVYVPTREVQWFFFSDFNVIKQENDIMYRLIIGTSMNQALKKKAHFQKFIRYHLQLWNSHLIFCNIKLFKKDEMKWSFKSDMYQEWAIILFLITCSWNQNIFLNVQDRCQWLGSFMY